MSEPFDLDAAKAARREAEGEPAVVIFGGTKYELPPAPPLSVLAALGHVQLNRFHYFDDVIAGMFGRDNVSDVLEAGFDMDDFADLFARVYGMDVGEAPASGG